MWRCGWLSNSRTWSCQGPYRVEFNTSSDERSGKLQNDTLSYRASITLIFINSHTVHYCNVSVVNSKVYIIVKWLWLIQITQDVKNEFYLDELAMLHYRDLSIREQKTF